MSQNGRDDNLKPEGLIARAQELLDRVESELSGLGRPGPGTAAEIGRAAEEAGSAELVALRGALAAVAAACGEADEPEALYPSSVAEILDAVTGSREVLRSMSLAELSVSMSNGGCAVDHRGQPVVRFRRTDQPAGPSLPEDAGPTDPTESPGATMAPEPAVTPEAIEAIESAEVENAQPGMAPGVEVETVEVVAEPVIEPDTGGVVEPEPEGVIEPAVGLALDADEPAAWLTGLDDDGSGALGALDGEIEAVERVTVAEGDWSVAEGDGAVVDPAAIEGPVATEDPVAIEEFEAIEGLVAIDDPEAAGDAGAIEEVAQSVDTRGAGGSMDAEIPRDAAPPATAELAGVTGVEPIEDALGGGPDAAPGTPSAAHGNSDENTSPVRPEAESPVRERPAAPSVTPLYKPRGGLPEDFDEAGFLASISTAIKTMPTDPVDTTVFERTIRRYGGEPGVAMGPSAVESAELLNAARRAVGLEPIEGAALTAQVDRDAAVGGAEAGEGAPVGIDSGGTPVEPAPSVQAEAGEGPGGGVDGGPGVGEGAAPGGSADIGEAEDWLAAAIAEAEASVAGQAEPGEAMDRAEASGVGGLAWVAGQIAQAAAAGGDDPLLSLGLSRAAIAMESLGLGAMAAAVDRCAVILAMGPGAEGPGADEGPGSAGSVMGALAFLTWASERLGRAAEAGEPAGAVLSDPAWAGHRRAILSEEPGDLDGVGVLAAVAGENAADDGAGALGIGAERSSDDSMVAGGAWPDAGGRASASGAGEGGAERAGDDGGNGGDGGDGGGVSIPREDLDEVLDLVRQLVLNKNQVRSLAESQRREQPGLSGAERLVLKAVEYARLVDSLQMKLDRTRVEPLSSVVRRLRRAAGVGVELSGGDIGIDRSVTAGIGAALGPVVAMSRGPARVWAEDKRYVVTIGVSVSMGGADGAGGDGGDGDGGDGAMELPGVPGATASAAASISAAAGWSRGEDGGPVFTLSVPVHGAVIEALRVSVGGETFALPVLLIREVVETAEHHMQTIHGQAMIRVREEIMPLIDAHGVLDTATGEVPPTAVIVGTASGSAAIRVDRVLGRQEIVIDRMGLSEREHGPFLGATIEDDGTIALVVDVERVVAEHLSRGSRRVFALSGADR